MDCAYLTKQGSHPGRILMVDDDPDIRDIYGEYLTQNGFELDFDTNGEEGYEKICQGGYDIILLDIMMPKIDGLGILHKVENEPQKIQNPNGPIIVLSNLDQSYIIETAMRLGAKGCIAKVGVTPDQALVKIGEFLKDATLPVHQGA